MYIYFFLFELFLFIRFIITLMIKYFLRICQKLARWQKKSWRIIWSNVNIEHETINQDWKYDLLFPILGGSWCPDQKTCGTSHNVLCLSYDKKAAQKIWLSYYMIQQTNGYKSYEWTDKLDEEKRFQQRCRLMYD